MFLDELSRFLVRASCFLCGGGDNPNVVCPACLQVHSLNEDLVTFSLAICEEEMCMTVKRWGNNSVFFQGGGRNEGRRND